MERINADGFTVREIAKYIRKGYKLKLTSSGWIMLKLTLIDGGKKDA
jgi:hypothetical protein